MKPAIEPLPLSISSPPPEPKGAQVIWIPIERIQTTYEAFRPGMVLGRADELSDLPIRVAPLEDGRFEVIDGFKRLERWGLDGCRQIPAVVERAGPPSVHKRMLLEANSPSRTLNPLAEGRVIESLLDDDQLTPTAVAKLLGRKKEWVLRRLTLASDLSTRAAECVADRTLGPTIAWHLTSLRFEEQDEVLKVRGKHGLSTRETILLIQAMRVVETGERKALLANPLATVRPPASPTASPRLADLEKRLAEIAQAIEEFSHWSIPGDLAPAERRRLEALQLGVTLDLIRLAHHLEDRPPPSPEQANLQEGSIPHDSPPSPTAARQGAHATGATDNHRSGVTLFPPGHCPPGPPIPQPGLQGPGSGRPASTQQERAIQARSLPDSDHRPGEGGTEGPPDPAGDSGDGLSGRSYHPGRVGRPAPGPTTPGRPEEDPAPF
jgi:ParB-like chromosome segregation protein Spo0J